jgi:hypothetical protein
MVKDGDRRDSRWIPGEPIDPSDRVLKLSVVAKNKEDFDAVGLPFLDFPAVAVRSPAIRVEANNLIKISVLVKRSIGGPTGVGGIIVRDSIGGEPLQLHFTGALPEFYRALLYRKAPADGTFTVTLGLAGYGEVFFDDFRVEVIEEDPRPGSPDPGAGLVQRRIAIDAPGLPDPRLPADAASGPSNSTRRQR